MIFGVVAAVGWGFADLLAAMTARNLGFFRVLVLSQMAALGSLTVLLIIATPDLGSPEPAHLLVLLALGAVMTAGYGAFYRALEIGQASVVTPLVASYAVIPAVLGPVILNEPITALDAAGIGTLLVGIVLTQCKVLSRTTGPRGGIALAGVAVVCLGLVAFLVAYYAKSYGSFLTVYTVRWGATLSLVVPAVRARQRGAAAGWGTLLLACLAGIFDNVGLLSFSRGSEVSHVSIVAAVSATHPIIPVVGGLILLRERITVTQGVGIAVVVGSLVALR